MHEIELKPSRRLGLLLAGLAGLALAATWTAALPVWLQVALSGLVAAAAVGSVWRAPTVLRLRQQADGSLLAQAADGDWREVEVLGDSFVSPALIVLRYQLEGERPRALTLLGDSAAAEDLRRLRVSLRWARRTRSDTSSPGVG